MLAVTGLRTSIVGALAGMIDDTVVRIDADLSKFDVELNVPIVDRYVLAAGYLCGKPVLRQSADEVLTSIAVNMVNTIRLCETILQKNAHARICVIGSESGYRGSFDQTYALAKTAVHKYVETRTVGPAQQLVAVAPHVILDSGMTRRRHDYEDLLVSGRRFITPGEVAEFVKYLLWTNHAWINNSVIRMAGGC